ncbi:Ada metal-binding domain-containing protein [Larkinella knui]|uniref:Metal-binding protein n=1 Tax=Larkinella knui TaxID=2025310 RepID=A0A3P1CU90_9BACT|nr:Ada metal-binding domain-containing protein [Larkinella knui]RRB16903.1 metal-binding protein [Larkinella knui]
MIRHTDFADNNLGKARLRGLIKAGAIAFGGNWPLKIYGTLHCQSGRRMLRKNRVFFQSEQDAILSGFRPCGHCMRMEYRRWKIGRATGSVHHAPNEQPL